MRDTLGLINQTEIEYLNLIVFNPYLMDKTIITQEYLTKEYKALFNILMDDHKKHKEVIVTNLMLYKEFDYNQYKSIILEEPYYSNLENKFRDIEKSLILNYKITKLKMKIQSANNYEEIYNTAQELNNININENEYIYKQDMINELVNNNKRIKTGYPLLDSAINLSSQDTMIIGGGTGTGKTAFALNLLMKLSVDCQCIYINLEMSKNILYKRIVGIMSRIPLVKLNNISALEENEKKIVIDAMDQIQERKIMLINRSMSINDIKALMSTIKTTKPKVLIVDHIGLVKSSGNSIYEKMTNIAKELRGISIDNNCLVIGLCQLSRDSQRNDTTPKLQDFRDSGEIEQSSRKALILHVAEEDKQQTNIEVDVIIAKNDDGPKAIKKFIFHRDIQRFDEKYV